MKKQKVGRSNNYYQYYQDLLEEIHKMDKEITQEEIAAEIEAKNSY